MSKALKGYNRWHGKHRQPIEGSLDIDYPSVVYPNLTVKEIIYRSAKWKEEFDPHVKRAIGGRVVGTVRNPAEKMTELVEGESCPCEEIQRNPGSSSAVQRYHHTFSSLFPPTLFTPTAVANNPGLRAPKLASELYCLGTCEALRVRSIERKDFSCFWNFSMLPLILGSDELGSLLLFYIPSKREFGLLKGGAFYISPRGLVW